jgi:hypothetical protein
MPTNFSGHRGDCARASDPYAQCTCGQSRIDLVGETPVQRNQLVQPADEREVAHFNAIEKVCGTCSKFNQSEAALAEIRNQKFYQRLVREEGWKLKHLGSPPETHGLCDETSGDDTKLTGAFHKACEHYRENRGLVKLSAKAR